MFAFQFHLDHPASLLRFHALQDFIHGEDGSGLLNAFRTQPGFILPRDQDYRTARECDTEENRNGSTGHESTPWLSRSDNKV